MPDQPTYHSQVLDHLGLVASMFDELGIGDVIDQATQQNPERRDLTVNWLRVSPIGPMLYYI